MESHTKIKFNMAGSANICSNRESKLGLRNRSFPSVVGMGNIKLFTDLSPYTEYKFTLREVEGNFIGNSTSISFNTSEDGKRYIRFSNLVQ